MKRIGFIGTGWTDIGQIKSFKKSGLIPQAIFSRSLQKAQKIADKYGILEVYTDWKDLIKSEKVDLISIVVPTWLHSDIIEYVREFDKHFICEAPFMSVAEAVDLIDNKKESNLEIIDYELRFTPHFRKVKEIIASNYIGKIISFDFKYENNFALDNDVLWDWSNDASLGGGYLRLVGGHFIDLAHWLFGEVGKIIHSEFDFSYKERIGKQGNREKITADDYALIKMQYTNEIRGKILVSQMSDKENDLHFLIEGTNGKIKINSLNELYIKNEKHGSFRKIDLAYDQSLFTGFDDNLFSIGTYFLGKDIIKYFKNGDYNFPTLEDALKNQKIIDEAYKTLPKND